MSTPTRVMTPEQRAALEQLGFAHYRGRLESFVRGAHRVLVRVNGASPIEFEPWTTYWNPCVRFADPVAAVVWVDVEGWGGEPSASAIDLARQAFNRIASEGSPWPRHPKAK